MADRRAELSEGGQALRADQFFLGVVKLGGAIFDAMFKLCVEISYLPFGTLLLRNIYSDRA